MQWTSVHYYIWMYNLSKLSVPCQHWAHISAQRQDRPGRNILSPHCSLSQRIPFIYRDEKENGDSGSRYGRNVHDFFRAETKNMQKPQSGSTQERLHRSQVVHWPPPKPPGEMVYSGSTTYLPQSWAVRNSEWCYWVPTRWRLGRKKLMQLNSLIITGSEETRQRPVKIRTRQHWKFKPWYSMAVCKI